MTHDPLRARRRELAKLHHPDRGGDPAEFDRAMRSLADPSPSPVAGHQHDIVFTPSARTRLRRGVAATRQAARDRVVALARLTRRAP